MVKKKKKKKIAEPAVEEQPELTKSTATPRELWRERARAYGLLLFSAILMPLGFTGFGIWPLAFVGMVPALFVFDADPRPTGAKFFLRSLFFGYIAFFGGFWWIVYTIYHFGEFPLPLAILFASIFFFYQGCQYVLMLWLWRRARDRGFGPTVALVPAFLAIELLFPMLFDHYFGNSFHTLLPLIQVADLGGPMMLTALAMLGNGAAYEIMRSRIRKEPFPKAAPLVFACTLIAFLGYGFWRIHDVETRAAASPHLTVAIVQANMGIDATRRNPTALHHRHVEESLRLERELHPDLLVWPESAVDWVTSLRNVRSSAYTTRRGLGPVTTPTLFGTGVYRRDESAPRGFRAYNVAILADGDGRVLGSYDKNYLLAFGEYIPFGDQFPALYEASPNTGQFTPGTEPRTLRFEDFRITPLVCYEDIVSRFVRRAVSEGDPHLLVNITNDAWFGDTHEPWVHLALAKFRAIEHRRYLVRATLTGVSAIVDPTGRLVAHSPPTDDAQQPDATTIHGEVAMMNGWTPYQTLGDWPGWVSIGAMIYMAFVGRWPRKKRTD